ncbi:hypothetical protein [Halalkalibacter akibai]|uniref:LysM domain-containing protein n=1 Tax=Halalkalibacter akibai (strain ATCC 43226 / DSM 21942 / CIP 109018 / JCM 9157 / 1139) TaxID=1236973 RepID=W4QQS2_HALA3|nr:hypothetical protein [Halalkalibacter akibai]GAE34435.1 hypothetical protein JCM9157_1491 [Halalkalibacter akibai JCM 9157]
MNKQLSLLYVPQTRVFQTFIIALMTIMVFSGFANGVSAERPNVKTIYHIYIDNEHIGTLLDDQPVYQYMTELLDSTKGQYSDVSLQVAEEVRVLPEFVFTEIEEDQSVLDSLEEQLTVQAEVTALMLGEEAIIHLASKKEAKQVIQDLITQYVDEETYSQFIEEEKNVDALEIGETIFTDISLTEELVEKEVLASPQDILTVEEAVNKLTKGVLEEQTYTVKEGDVLGTIADNHNLSTSNY